ncbi:MAG: PilX N-terminal domain-containing pilus assembly protein [Gammaproteobacteria bacterium]|jgi:hypothetical protein
MTMQRAPQSGYVLVTALIFLLVLTLVAVIATKNTSLELRMSRNFTNHVRSFETSEGTRLAINDLVDAHVYNRGWPTTVTGGTIDPATFASPIPPGLTILDKDGDGVPDDLYIKNDAGENVLDPGTLDTDMTYSRTVNGETMTSKLSVFKLGTSNNPGSSTAMISGYEGTGKATAGSGGAVYFQLRSVAEGLDGAIAVTASVYRHVVRD